MSATLKVLSLLEAYEERQHEAQKIWKKSQWNLTKAKQSKGSAEALTATDLREDLRPRCVLVEAIPELVEEGASKDYSTVPHFRVVDPVEHEQIDKENATTKDGATVAGAEKKGSSLRNRKAKEPESKKEWTVTEDSKFMDEETKLRSVDPIALFGLPTRELRQAKQEAQRALALYVEAANFMLALQQEMDSETRK